MVRYPERSEEAGVFSPTIPRQRSRGLDDRQEQALEPIECQCSEARHQRRGPHRDWRAELERARRAGCVVDEIWFAAIAVEAGLDRAEPAA